MAKATTVKRPALTQERQVRRLQAESKPYEHSIKDSRGLLVRISPKGKKTWVYRYRRRDTGKLERMTLGNYPAISLSEARTEVGVQRALVKEHVSARDFRDAARETKRQDTATKIAKLERSEFTVRELVAKYTEFVSDPSNDRYIKSWKKVSHTLDLKLVSARFDKKGEIIGDIPANEIKRVQMIGLVDAIAKASGPVMANRFASYARRLWNWAMDRELLEHNPCDRLPRRKEKATERNLTITEARKFWGKVGDVLGVEDADFCRLMLLTGMRPIEVAGLISKFIDFDEKTITLPEPKNGVEHIIPLTKSALKIVKRRCGARMSPLFPMKSDPKRCRRPDSIDEPLREALPGLGIEPFTPRDLRRTTATRISALGAPRLIVKRVLNHTDREVTAVYDRHRYTDEMRDWLQKWADHIDDLVKPKKGAKAGAA